LGNEQQQPPQSGRRSTSLSGVTCVDQDGILPLGAKQEGEGDDAQPAIVSTECNNATFTL